MEAYLDWQKKTSGIKLNDVIEEYRYVAAGKQIKAGDLVNYINGIAGKVDYGESVDTQLSTEVKTGQVISAVALDESRVFIAHSYGSNRYLYGTVCTIDGATITVVTDTQLSTTSYTGDSISTCLLSKDKVFIAHSHGSSYYLYGMVVTISGTTITAGTDTVIDSESNTSKIISAVALDENRVFIAYSYGSTYLLFAVVASINGVTISIGQRIALNGSTSQTGNKISTCLLPNGNVFISHTYGSNYYLYGIVCSISGTTITAGSDTAISSTNNAGDVFSLVGLDDARVFISFRDSGNVILQAIVCTLSGTTISKGTITQLSSVGHTAGGKLANLLLPNGDVLIIHSSGSNYSIAGMICKVNGTTIANGTDIELISLETSARQLNALLLGDIVFVAHINNNTNYHLYAQIFGIDYENNIPTNNIVITEYEQQVTPAIEPPFNAIALSSGVGGTDTGHKDQVKIARVYKEVEKEVRIQGNTVPKSWTKQSNTECIAANGDKLSFGSDDSDSIYVPNINAINNPLSYMCDGNSSTSFVFERKGGEGAVNAWVIYETQTPIAISKFKIKSVYLSSPPNGIVNDFYFQGRDNGETWETLHTFTENTNELTEIAISNTKKWNKYRFYLNINLPDEGYTSSIYIDEFQVSEYIEKVTEVIQ